ncbi:hypothetical protein C8F01DRAFT_1286320 [Mycena amicta]|nr:hypothetical protein C8F01DRAFT_1286320 [Mycena amicta]
MSSIRTTTNKSPSKAPATRMIMRSKTEGRFYWRRDPPATPIVPKSYLALRKEMTLLNRITQSMEDNDEIYRGETTCPADYAPLTPDEEDNIIANLPVDNGLAMVTGPPEAFAELFSESPPSTPRASRTYAGRANRSFLPDVPAVTASATATAGGTASASVTSGGGATASATAVSNGEGGSATVTASVSLEMTPRRSSRLSNNATNVQPTPAPAPSRRTLPREYRRRFKLLIGHADPILPTPFVDSQETLLSVLLRGPSSQKEEWAIECDALAISLIFLSDLGGFDAGPLRWGIGFHGGLGAGAATLREPDALVFFPGEDLTQNTMLSRISVYQNDAAQQFFPSVHSAMAVQLEAIVAYNQTPATIRNQLVPPFPNSIFSTCELVRLSSASATRQKRWEVRFHHIMAVTVLGIWDSEQGGHIMMHHEGRMVQLKNGDTLILPAGAQAYSFVPVGEAEDQFLFCQFFHSSVARWLEKGGMGDTELERKAKVHRNKDCEQRLHRWMRAEGARRAG